MRAMKKKSTLIESMDDCSCSDMDHPVKKTLEIEWVRWSSKEEMLNPHITAGMTLRYSL